MGIRCRPFNHPLIRQILHRYELISGFLYGHTFNQRRLREFHTTDDRGNVALRFCHDDKGSGMIILSVTGLVFEDFIGLSNRLFD